MRFQTTFWGTKTTSAFDLDLPAVRELLEPVIAEVMTAVEVHGTKVERLEVTDHFVRAFPKRPIPGIRIVEMPIPKTVQQSLSRAA